MKAIIMAGGYAKRMWPLTKEIAKPLLPVAGKPIIDYVLEKIDVDVDKIFISTNERFGPQFKKWIESKNDSRLVLVVEKTRSEEEKLGAVGAIDLLIKEQNIDDDILIIGGDNLLTFTISQFISGNKNNPIVACYDFEDPSKLANTYGTVEVENNKVIGFEEKPSEPKSSLASTACYFYPKHVLPMFKEYLSEGHSKDAPGFFLKWLHKKLEVNCFSFETGWYDIGDRESYIKANQEFFEGSMIEGEAQESEVIRSYVGKNSVVMNSTLENCVVLDKCEVIESNLKNCVVGFSSVISNTEKENELLGSNSQTE